VLDGVRMFRAGLLEESLKVVCWSPRPALNATPGAHNIHHVRVIYLLIIVIVVSCGCNPIRVLLSPLLAALGVLLGSLDGATGWCRFAAIKDHVLAGVSEGGALPTLMPDSGGSLLGLSMGGGGVHH
jgi:hypothetical protein